MAHRHSLSWGRGPPADWLFQLELLAGGGSRSELASSDSPSFCCLELRRACDFLCRQPGLSDLFNNRACLYADIADR